MKRKYALLFAFMITALIAFNSSIFNSLNNAETAVILRVIDGDTLELEDGRIIRLLNVNTPEKNEFGSELGTEYLKTFEGSSVNLKTEGVDKYERTLARIYSQNSDYINLELVKKGYAKKFLVSSSELSDFSKAEDSAVKNFLGIWKKSNFYDCLNADIDEDAEIVKIKNLCEADMSNWIIKDESRKTLVIPKPFITGLSIHSSGGEDNETDIFWDSNTNIWNNDRDTLYLLDSESKIILHESYGY